MRPSCTLFAVPKNEYNCTVGKICATVALPVRAATAASVKETDSAEACFHLHFSGASVRAFLTSSLSASQSLLPIPSHYQHNIAVPSSGCNYQDSHATRARSLAYDDGASFKLSHASYHFQVTEHHRSYFTMRVASPRAPQRYLQ